MPSATLLPERATIGKILLADDDLMFRESTSALLQQAGYVCDVVHDAESLREATSRIEYDLIIADIVMPGNTRLELLRGRSATVTPPLMLVTGYPTIDSAACAVRSNVVGYLVKPFDPEQFLESVRREVDAEQARRLIRRRRMTVESLLNSLRDLEETLCDHRQSQAPETLNTYLAILTKSTVSAIHDLHALVEVIVAREGDLASRRRLDGSRPLLLVDALREVITVLERTKRAFKSKELADLRARLEELLQTADS